MKTFPMFLKMQDRHVVIVGGGEQAAQKARLMLKTEAEIVLLSHELDEELRNLVATGRAHHDTDAPGVESFAGAALVFIATGCVGLDAALHALAKEAGALVNVVDQPDLCDAYTPSIVDRDPVVVAIGTEGNAPVLGRMIKTQVEELLEPRLGDMARLAGRLREAVTHHVAPEARRGFWRWMFSGEPRRLHARGSEHRAARLLKQAIAAGQDPQARLNGTVSLVGAGPGDADLLTLRAVQRLQEADIIFVAPGIDPALLEQARRDAERVHLPVPDGALAWPRERLEQRISTEARHGRSVVYLLAETPSMAQLEPFEALDDEGILVELVPGAMAAVPASAGGGSGQSSATF
ncbi:NAD(P)-dependent oxidoreductase [Aliiruegeria lutimaris]|uniref:precorrin-2 dehydrogenase n=1 Tax=Aliiruegeria lutimaris TaxID=571298 RepID=A0A1G9EHE2_9RHOB|nr:NAD(P)-dependent oxidoreductase [Aliiruegeria lutimaris]SDK75562.1 uroporphyrin-III C-methyltransferase / precorrin-2 dehydrogenase / sirohydrochlorin ferrochelatase [Aliiruegeria lutimaris]